MLLILFDLFSFMGISIIVSSPLLRKNCFSAHLQGVNSDVFYYGNVVDYVPYRFPYP